jgi:hypothetical protein
MTMLLGVVGPRVGDFLGQGLGWYQAGGSVGLFAVSGATINCLAWSLSLASAALPIGSMSGPKQRENPSQPCEKA